METTITLEINEIETEVKVSFTSRFGVIEIEQITDVVTGDSIAPDLLDGMMTKIGVDRLYEDLHEYAADQSIELENTYHNI